MDPSNVTVPASMITPSSVPVIVRLPVTTNPSVVSEFMVPDAVIVPLISAVAFSATLRSPPMFRVPVTLMSPDP